MSNPWVQIVPIGAPAGAQTPYACDWMQSPFAIGWDTEFQASATCTYNVEYTFDDVNTVASPVWWPAITNGQTAGAQATLTTPCRFLRINATTGPATNTVTFRAIQGQTSR